MSEEVAKEELAIAVLAGQSVHEALVNAYRKSNPRSRIVSILKYVRNGSGVKQMGCVICGARGPTWCGKWRKTKRATDWEYEHLEQHGC